MVIEIFLYKNLMNSLLTNKNHHKFALEMLENLDYLSYQEKRIKKWLKIKFIKSEYIYFETIMLFQGNLVSWNNIVEELIDYCQKHKITIFFHHLNPSLISIISMTIKAYEHLFDEPISTYSDNEIKRIFTLMKTLENELYTLNNKNKVINIHNINTFWINMKQLTNLLEKLFWEMRSLIRDSWI